MRRIADFAREHHGLFTGLHAAMVGIDGHEIEYALRVGEIVAPHEGVYRFAAAPVRWECRLLAACWAGGFRAMASHRSAAELWSVPGRGRDLLEVLCPRWRRARHGELVVHEMSGLSDDDVRLVRGIPVTSVPLTLLGLAAVQPGIAELALENALRRELTTMAEVEALLRRFGGRGRRGSRRLQQLVRTRDPKLRLSASEMETLFFAALRRHGVPLPQRQVVVRDHGRFIARIDGGWPEWRVGYEYDSDEFHTGRVATARDSARRHRLTALGWNIVTVVRPDLEGGGALACAAVAALLTERSSCVAIPR